MTEEMMKLLIKGTCNVLKNSLLQASKLQDISSQEKYYKSAYDKIESSCNHISKKHGAVENFVDLVYNELRSSDKITNEMLISFKTYASKRAEQTVIEARAKLETTETILTHLPITGLDETIDFMI